MSKLCPKCHKKLEESDICFHYKKPHPRSNAAYYCPNCKEVSCWQQLIDDKTQFESQSIL
ncbi:MAG: hypothetical protein KGD59_11515 [Candidatus Heimdallarchaeota archaeon]|nr:hypothetical protein [Candidatus Heimdallarchaeota archaeon]MBY8995171.1 hypothetical protein [Candidatus Heimdallarchaeota archaeon]